MYPTESQVMKCQWCVQTSLREGGDVVLVRWYFWGGENLHQFSSRFGTNYGGRRWGSDLRYSLLAKANRVLLLTPHLSWYDRQEIGPPTGFIWSKEWADILTHLTARHGARTKVAVYPYAPLQMAKPLAFPSVTARPGFCWSKSAATDVGRSPADGPTSTTRLPRPPSARCGKSQAIAVRRPNCWRVMIATSTIIHHTHFTSTSCSFCAS